nr:rna-binding protein rnp24 [Quercus suber]
MPISAIMPSSTLPSDKKRRRVDTAPDEELEIDINLPEPPSKKAKRKEKKQKSDKPKVDREKSTVTDNSDLEEEAGDEVASAPSKIENEVKRSAHGIWIGNLAFSVTKDALRQFFSDGLIPETEITRIHMPTPRPDPNDRRAIKPQNRGFAYVDFSNEDMLEKAIALSEKLLIGRRVLIKNAKSFEGRPEKTVEQKKEDGVAAGKKEPTKRIFVGNLSFDVTVEDLTEHFTQAGVIEDVHMATFEDSGKCKGFAWVRFAQVESAEAAVKGFIFKQPTEKNEDDEEESSKSDEDVKSTSDESNAEAQAKFKGKKVKVKKNKKEKWFINRLHGRPLRCEFAEDAQTRYKKRYGPQKKEFNGANGAPVEARKPFSPRDATDASTDVSSKPKGRRERGEAGKEARREERRQKHVDARTIAPGQALARAERQTGAIVEAKGTKVSFE